MDKARIFIASSGRTLTLAEKLRDELETDFCTATLWREEGRRQPGAVIIEMLLNASASFDFAAIVLAKDDVVVRNTGDALKARDNCVFEAGLFMSSLGRDRCFLVNSVAPADLPSDLAGVISVPFSEPPDLADRAACASAVRTVGMVMKERIQKLGRPVAEQRVPILPLTEVFRRERAKADGGDLLEGQVVVCDLQPHTGADGVLQVGRNLRRGVSYLYFLHFADDTMDKILQGLQVVAATDDEADGPAPDFEGRLVALRVRPQQALERLSAICHARSLMISFMPTEPLFRFRVHNASDPIAARLYLRMGNGAFMLWSEGAVATSIWQSMPNWISTDDKDRLFVPIKQIVFEGEMLHRFEQALERGLNRYFPGMQKEVRRICTGPEE